MNDHVERQYVSSLADDLWAAAQPATQEEFTKPIVRAAAVLSFPDRSEAEWTTVFDVYLDVLGHLPASAVAAGMRDYLARPDAEFLPKPGPLLAMCEPHASLARALAVGSYVIANTEPVDPNDGRAMAKQWAEMVEMMVAKSRELDGDIDAPARARA